MRFRPSLVVISSLLLVLAGLSSLPSPAGAATLSEADEKLFGAAFQRAERGAYGAARAMAAGGNQALLGKFFRWLDLTRGNDEGDFQDLTAFLQANPPWPRLGRIRSGAEKNLPADMTRAEVLAWFGDQAPLTVEGALRLAEALDAPAATDLLRKTWIGGRFTRGQERSFRARYAGRLRRGDEIARLETLLGRRQVATARRQARRIGDGYPELAKARLDLSLDRPGVDAAIGRVPAGLRNDPGLLYERARWRRRRGRTEGVVEMIDAAAPVILRPGRWWPLRRWAARRSLNEGDFATAYRMASGHGLAEGTGFADGEWLSGWIALRFLNEPKPAYRHFTRLHDGVGSPISLARGAYWAAEAAAALGNAEAAARWYRRAAGHGTAFYGQRASARIGEPLQVDLAAAAAAAPAARAAFEERELVRLVHLLGAFDERKHQETFLHHLRRRAETAREHLLVIELADSVGRPDLAVATAKQARRKGFLMPAELFPLPAGVGDAVAAAPTPEPALVLAVIRQESVFDSQAVSRAGARGLMQLMPATAHKVSHALKIPYRRALLTEDPAANLRLGRAYLGQLLDDYSGTNILALAAYNAGPGRVRSWIGKFGDPRDPDVDPTDWIESIPFDETRNYVQRVLEGQVVYRLALTGQRTVMPLSLAAQMIGKAD